jgi:mRNA interferase MazF
MTFDQFDVVTVPFPFSDGPQSKRRKALVISHNEFNRANQNTMLLMITSATQSSWLNDVSIQDLKSAGLNKKCVVRMKSFTLDNSLLLDRCGRLSATDATAVLAAFKKTCAIS